LRFYVLHTPLHFGRSSLRASSLYPVPLYPCPGCPPNPRSRRGRSACAPVRPTAASPCRFGSCSPSPRPPRPAHRHRASPGGCCGWWPPVGRHPARTHDPAAAELARHPHYSRKWVSSAIRLRAAPRQYITAGRSRLTHASQTPHTRHSRVKLPCLSPAQQPHARRHRTRTHKGQIPSSPQSSALGGGDPAPGRGRTARAPLLGCACRGVRGTARRCRPHTRAAHGAPHPRRPLRGFRIWSPSSSSPPAGTEPRGSHHRRRS
jgi:hypothetical protein